MMYEEYRRALMFFEARQYTEAARLLAPLLEAEPGNRSLVELQARAYFHSAQLGRAEGALNRLLELAPDDGWAREALARTLERAGRPGEARVHRRLAGALGVAPAEGTEAVVTAANLVS
ncbi:tetratricopeptide repeat protein [Actinocorallia longicatena]|uniref:Tetratricopeptide repeat protein n=1 Tax=Actinocorallia longicatena TaxID=111803 RepID=A0ABP6QBR3_9ACTN